MDLRNGEYEMIGRAQNIPISQREFQQSHGSKHHTLPLQSFSAFYIGRRIGSKRYQPRRRAQQPRSRAAGVSRMGIIQQNESSQAHYELDMRIPGQQHMWVFMHLGEPGFRTDGRAGAGNVNYVSRPSASGSPWEAGLRSWRTMSSINPFNLGL